MNFSGRSYPYLLWLVAAGIFAAGCGQDDIKVYSVPKERATAPAGDGHHHHDEPPKLPEVQWQKPANWEQLPPSQMRVGSFRVAGSEGKQADVSIIPLPGGAGSDLDNVNRWRGQVGLSPVAQEELPSLGQPVEVAGQSAALYEQAGEKIRILAVIYRREGVAWFFKMTGDAQLVADAKPAFVSFLKSVQFRQSASAAAEPDEPAKPKWTIPAGWQATAGGQFLVAKFVIAGEAGATAAVNVSTSPGDGGGITANVNRWRKQLGLAEGATAEIEKSVQTQNGISVVELTGEKAALIAAVVPRSGQTWFYKLMGDPKIVEAQKAAFLQFVQGVQY